MIARILFLACAISATPAAAQERAGNLFAAANAEARRASAPESFVGARAIYAYAPGALYELQASPNYVSLILLEPGERVSAIAAGDTSRWQISEAEGEGEHEPRAMLMVKPQAANLRTNVVIVTDRRTYLIEARADGGRAYAAEIAWTYPAPAPRAEANIANWRFDYRVRTLRGRPPAWTPARVFDDGRRTYVEFAEAIATGDLPPLFILTGEGVELANYRLEGRRYIVDRLFDAAELRFGVRDQIIVRIERGDRPESAPRLRRGRP